MSVAAASELPVPPDVAPERTLSAPEWGMASFLLSEAAFFGTLIVTYVAFIGRDVVGPTPAEALSLPIVIVSTLCLLSSSVAVHAAERALDRFEPRFFLIFWGLAIALGGAFLALTAAEWHDLVTRHQLTIGRNLFGTTYYTLVGFHALHVTVGVVAMCVVWLLAMRQKLFETGRAGVSLVSWYWHFVDAVWIVVFVVVYVISRSSGA